MLCNKKKCLKKKTCFNFTTFEVKGWQKYVNLDYDKGAVCYKIDYELIKEGEK
jgi:hypothetical protein